MKVITIGTDSEITESLCNTGHDVETTEDYGTDALQKAGVEEADAVVIGKGYATQVIVTKQINPDARVVMVTDDVPEFVSGNADVILSVELSDRLPDALETEEKSKKSENES